MSDGHECPKCDREFSTAQGLGQHHSAKHGEKLRYTISCEYCDEDESVKPYEVDSRRFCSPECKAEWESENKSGEDSPLWEDTRVRQCATDYCVQEFPVYPSTEGREYCSPECRGWGPWRDAELMKHLYETIGLSQADIGDHLGCYQTTVGRWLERHNIPPRPQVGEAADPRLKSKEWLREAYVDKEMTSSEIGEWVGTSHNVVWQWCQKHGIETDWPWSVDELRDEEWLVSQYVDERRSTISIASELGCGAQAVADWLQRYGVELRNPHEPGEEHPLWDPDSIDEYGPNWEVQAEKARERDNHECQSCGVGQEDHPTRLPVHHKIPRSTFIDDGQLDYVRANRLDNLITLCHSCHPKYEQMAPLCPIAD